MKIEDVRKTLAENFVAALNEDPLRWHQGFISTTVPKNGVYGRRYRGLNRFILTFVLQNKGYEDPRFYPQNYIFGNPENRAKEWDDPTKIKVKKGEKPYWIDTMFFVPTEEGSKQGLKPISPPVYFSLEPNERKEFHPVRKPLPVYNAEQVTGIEPYKAKEHCLQLSEKEVKAAVDKAVENMKIQVEESKFEDSPRYNFAEDKIYLPAAEKFKSEQAYYGTKLHEVAHATGHESRLNRQLTGNFGSEEYAIEELHAEIASCFMATEFGLQLGEADMENHKAYVQSWAEAIQKDAEVLMEAIVVAEKIADYVEEKAELDLPIDVQLQPDQKVDVQPKFEVKTNLRPEKAAEREKQHDISIQ